MNFKIEKKLEKKHFTRTSTYLQVVRNPRDPQEPFRLHSLWVLTNYLYVLPNGQLWGLWVQKLVLLLWPEFQNLFSHKSRLHHTVLHCPNPLNLLSVTCIKRKEH